MTFKPPLALAPSLREMRKQSEGPCGEWSLSAGFRSSDEDAPFVALMKMLLLRAILIIIITHKVHVS